MVIKVVKSAVTLDPAVDVVIPDVNVVPGVTVVVSLVVTPGVNVVVSLVVSLDVVVSVSVVSE